MGVSLIRFLTVFLVNEAIDQSVVDCVIENDSQFQKAKLWLFQVKSSGSEVLLKPRKFNLFHFEGRGLLQMASGGPRPPARGRCRLEPLLKKALSRW